MFKSLVHPTKGIPFLYEIIAEIKEIKNKVSNGYVKGERASGETSVSAVFIDRFAKLKAKTRRKLRLYPNSYKEIPPGSHNLPNGHTTSNAIIIKTGWYIATKHKKMPAIKAMTAFTGNSAILNPTTTDNAIRGIYKNLPDFCVAGLLLISPPSWRKLQGYC